MQITVDYDDYVSILAYVRHLSRRASDRIPSCVSPPGIAADPECPDGPDMDSTRSTVAGACSARSTA
ncbi:hypothetical protein, partial [Amaricoccus sp.]|uniref:hypothetical protein n=1 Tax=Amaricoccus sp. TaxID=1872485 RepID=UPI001B43808F